ncbi:MAG: ACP S-malonyltransferase [Verrucomicrobia bacterium]|nr:ACP S-malonyltransferase [Verrucomicrobiota bacterium]
MKKLAMVFPGGGSQQIGMFSDMIGKYPTIKETFKEASEVAGYDMWELSLNGPKEKQDAIEYTLPLMLTANVALYRTWISLNGQKPEIMAGHSLGEYSALVSSEALQFKDAVALVALRGKLMQEAVPIGHGQMAAIIGLDDNSIYALCQEASQGEVISPANFNSIGQVVIAGTTNAINRAIAIAKAKKAKVATVLPVSIPSHCPLMKPASDEMAKALDKVSIQSPKIPVLHNFDVMSHNDPTEIRKVLVDQLTNPVRWVDTVNAMEKMDITDIIECGPGKALVGMVKWISRTIVSHSIYPLESMVDTHKKFT